MNINDWKPQPNEIRHGSEIGREPPNRKYIFRVCADCGEGAWRSHAKAMKKRCPRCSQKNRWRGVDTREGCNFWKSGRTKSHQGYFRVLLMPGDFFLPTADKSRYVLEHRLVMAKHLNRNLLRWEVVHHKNGNKEDNRIENLELLPHGRHHLPSMVLQAQIGRLEKRLRNLEERVTILEAENTVLRAVNERRSIG